MPLPTATATAKPAAGHAPAPVPATPPIPFLRASRSKSAAITTLSNTMTAAQLNFPVLQVRPAGFLARIKLLVTGTTAGNAAAVAFNPDAPFNSIVNIGLTSPEGGTLIQTITGWDLFLVNKYLGLASGKRDPLAYPGYSVTTGAGATGGSFKFVLEIPIEIDSRDAFGVLANMNATQQFQVTLSLNTLAAVYSVAPTNAPIVTVQAVMEYYSAPAATNADGYPQETAPGGLGTLNLIATQQPPINASTVMKSQLLNVGNTIRATIFELRDVNGVRTETDFPEVFSVFFNNDLYYYKVKELWRAQMVDEYGFTGGVSAAPALNALDQGVFVLTDFMNSGQSGGMHVDGASNRNKFMVTAPGTSYEVESTQAYGANAKTLTVIQNLIMPATVQSLYAPEIY